MRKKRSLIISTLLIMCALLIGSVVFAYYVHTTDLGQQTITTSNIVFKVNGLEINNVPSGSGSTPGEVGFNGQFPLEILTKGEEKILNFEIQTITGVNMYTCANYNISFSYAKPNILAQAIEVYEYKNGKYNFMGMLDTIPGFTGILPANAIQNLNYKFVLSPACGDFYENKQLDLTINVDSSFIKQDQTEVYIRSGKDLQEILLHQKEFAGKTIVLASQDKTVTIPFDSNVNAINSYVITEKISIDLNGNTLKLDSGVTLKYQYAHNFDSIPTCIKSSFMGGKLVSDNNAIILDTANDFVAIQQDVITPAQVNVVAFSANSIGTYLNSSNSTPVTLAKGDNFDLLGEFNHYNLSIVYDSETIKVYNKDTKKIIYNGQHTIEHNFAFTINGSINVSTIIILRGLGNAAIAQYYLAQVPDTVKSNLFLPSYDELSNAKISWVTSEPNTLDENGVFIRNGYEGLTSWTDRSIYIGVIVNTPEGQFSQFKQVNVKLFSAKEKSEFLYNYKQYAQIILKKKGDSLKLTDILDNTLLQISHLQSLTISIDDPTLNQDNEQNLYMTITDINTNGITEQLLSYVIQVQNKTSLIMPAKLHFVFDDGGSYDMTRDIVLLGEKSAYDFTDAHGEIQKVFTDNAYTRNEGYEFDALGYTKSGAKIDYFVSKEAEKYVFVENDIYTVVTNTNINVEDGFLYKDGENYIYFNSRYKKVQDTNEYVVDPNGAYIFLGKLGYMELNPAINSNKIYTRKARIRLLPNKIPCEPMVHVAIKSKLWKDIDPTTHEKIYLTDEWDRVIEYEFVLQVKGIYHNIPNEIEDFNLYNKLLQLLDINNNGYIEYDESLLDWSTLNGLSTYTDIDGVAIKYLDCSNSDITSLKGLEYFPLATGYDFSNNSLTSTVALSNLYDLQYLNLHNTTRRSVNSLSYLDKLRVLDLSNNQIRDVTPIQQLPNVIELYLQYNNSLKDFTPIKEYRKLKKLNIIQETNINTNNLQTKYILSLISSNNPAVEIYTIDDKSKITFTDVTMVASEVLNNLVVIQETCNTLYCPGEYTYKGKQYYLLWDVQGRSSLDFINDRNQTFGYNIHEVIVDENIEIAVRVTQKDDTENVTTQSKIFNLTLLADITIKSYIQISPTQVLESSVAFPDVFFRKEVFDNFNYVRTGQVVINGVEYENRYIITLDELSNYPFADLDLSNRYIENLQGIEYLKDALINKKLILTGNVLTNADISEISKIDQLSGLVLGGQRYDFKQLCETTQPGDPLPYLGSEGKFKTDMHLKELYVQSCYDVKSNEILTDLFRVFLSNPGIKIYIDGDKVWNPYIEPLSKLMQSLPTVFWFDEINVTKSIFLGDQTEYLFRFYGIKDVEFIPSKPILYGRYASNFAITKDATHDILGLTLLGFVPQSDTCFLNVKLKAKDSSIGVPDTSHLYTLKVDLSAKVRIDGVAIGKVFPSVSLKEHVLNIINDKINNHDNGVVIGNGYYDITSQNLKTWTATPITQQIIIDGKYEGDYALRGLSKTGFTNVFLINDVNIGNGSELVNIVTLSIGNSGIDMNKISTNLPNLKNLYLGANDDLSQSFQNTYCKINFSKMPSLEIVYLLSSNIYSWNNLSQLPQSLKVLRIHGTYEMFTNINNVNNATIQTVKDLYSTFPQNAKPQIYLGTTEDTKDSTTLFDPADWEVLPEINYHVKNNKRDEYIEFVAGNKMIQNGFDLPVQITAGGTTQYYWSYPSQQLVNGNILKLPHSTEQFAFGLNMQLGSNYKYELRDFNIVWRVYGIDYLSFNNIFSTNLTQANEQNSTTLPKFGCLVLDSGVDYNLTIKKPAYDTYIVVEGTLGEEFNNSQGNTVPLNEFLYPIFIKGKNQAAPNTTSFASFPDDSLKFNIFTMMLDCGFIQNGAISGVNFSLFTEISINSIMNNMLKEAKFGLSYTYNGVKSQVVYEEISSTKSGVKRAQNITSLQGIELFSNLQILRIQNNKLKNLQGVQGLTKLKTLSITHGTLSDISALNGLAKLQNINLSDNYIRSVAVGNDNVFNASKNSIVSLDLSYNGNISLDSIKTFNNSLMPKVKTLAFAYMGEYNNIEVLKTIINLITDATKNMQGEKHIMLSAGIMEAPMKTILEDLVKLKQGYDSIYTKYNNNGRNFYIFGEYLSQITDGKVKLIDKNLNTDGAIDEIFTTKVEITHSFMPNIPVICNINCKFNNASYYDLKVGNIVLTHKDFDPAIWMYLTSQNGNVLQKNHIKLDPNFNTVNINTDCGVTSLKGLEKIPQIKTIIIKNNPVTDLGWIQNNNSITKLEIANTLLTENSMKSISKLTKLSTLDLSLQGNIDYMVGNGGSLGNTITTLPLKVLYINNQFNADMFTDVFSSFIRQQSFYNINNKVFNINTAKQINTFNEISIMSGYNSFANTSTITFNSYIDVDNMLSAYLIENNGNSYANYYTKGYIQEGKKEVFRKIKIKEQYDNNFGLTNRYILSILNFNNMYSYRQNYPKSIYANDLSKQNADGTTGVILYLPSTFNYLAIKRNVTYKIFAYRAHPQPNKDSLSKDVTSATITTDANKTILNLTNENLQLSWLIFSDLAEYITIEIFVDGVSINNKTPYEIAISDTNSDSGEGRQSKEYLVVNGSNHEVSADTIFKSNNLADFLFNYKLEWEHEKNYNKSEIKIVPTEADLAPWIASNGAFLDWLFGSGRYFVNKNVGKVMKANCYTNTTKLSILGQRASYDKDYSLNISSLDGLELFSNLTHLSIEQNSYMDINALSQLKLQELYLYNSYSGDNNYIQDFSPLLNPNGSKPTLTTFTYCHYSNTAVPDLSFIMGLDNIQNVYLYSHGENKLTQYTKTARFKYMIAYLELNKPTCKIYVNDVAQVAETNYKKAVTIFNNYDSGNYDNANDITYTDNYEIRLNSVKTNDILLPINIDYSGANFAIDYTSMSSHIEIGKIKFIASTGKTYNFASIGRPLVSNDLITYDEYVKLLDEHEYISDYVAGKANCYQLINIINGADNINNVAYIKGRIFIDDAYYERMFSIYINK